MKRASLGFEDLEVEEEKGTTDENLH